MLKCLTVNTDTMVVGCNRIVNNKVRHSVPFIRFLLALFVMVGNVIDSSLVARLLKKDDFVTLRKVPTTIPRTNGHDEHGGRGMAGEKAQLGERLRQLRKSHKETQEALARVVGCSRDHISQVETGRSDLSAHFARRIAQHYGIPVEALYTAAEEFLADHTEEILRARAWLRVTQGLPPVVVQALLDLAETFQHALRNT